MAGTREFVSGESSPEHLRALWDRVNTLARDLAAANTAIASLRTEVASLKTSIATVDRTAQQAQIKAGT